jgi:hypothetical protein
VLGKIVLWVTAVMFTGYGIACLVSPALPAGYAGLAMTNGDAVAEIGAMYGGLQTGFGIFCLLGTFNKTYYRPALMLLVIAIGLLAVGRLYTALMADGSAGFYTWAAMSYEFATAILAAIALRLR